MDTEDYDGYVDQKLSMTMKQRYNCTTVFDPARRANDKLCDKDHIAEAISYLRSIHDHGGSLWSRESVM